MMTAEGPCWPYVGIDLTAGARPSDLAALDARGREVIFAEATTDDEILAEVGRLGGRIVAVDSPMALPLGLCCLETSCPCAPRDPRPGRSAERALAALGIPCFWTTKRTIIKRMVYRAIALKARLEAAGLTVLEVYPYAVKRVLLGRALPKKQSPEGLAALVAGARRQLPDCGWPDRWAPGHDQLDALYCAITARLHHLGETECLGDPEEVPIILPRLRN
jgi:predicted nuclease with RNAse H fold